MDLTSVVYVNSEKNVNVQRMAAITGKLGMQGGVKQGSTTDESLGF